MDDNSNLEKYFRQQFSQNFPQEPWNTPDENIWSNINKELDKKPKRRNILFFIPWLFMAMTTLFSVYTWKINIDQFNKITALEKIIIKCSNQSKKIDSSPVISGSDSGNEKISPNRTPKGASQINAAIITAKDINSYKSFQKSKDSKTNFNKSKSTLKQLSFKYTPNTKASSQDSTRFVLADKEKTNLRSTISIDKLTNIKTNFNILSNRIISPNISKGVPDTKVLSHPFYFGPTIRLNQWKDISSGALDNPLRELLTDEKTNPSLSYGIQSSYTINKHLTLNAGIYYNKKNQQSTYLLQIPYTTNTEIISNSGEYTNTFHHNLPSGLGNIQTDLLLTRSQGSSISQNEVVKLDFSFNNNISSIITPISISFFPKNSNEGLFFNAGIQGDVIVRSKVMDIRTLSHHTFVKDKHVSVNFETSQINKLNLSAIAGFGYQKNIFEKIDLKATLQYGMALTDTYSTNTYRHKLNNLSFNISSVQKLGSN